MKKPVIAIDGHSSTGKSSISKVIAQRLGLIHLDTGALYRGITFYALKNCLDETGNIDLAQVIEKLTFISLEFKPVDGELELYLNGENVSREIRTQKVSDNVSMIASQKEIREFLLDAQRKMAKNGGIIMDGRDIGTVILPDADYKFFLTASIEERTKRRFLELQSLGIHSTEEEVRENLIFRDKADSERQVAPLRQADDALVIDNSKLTKAETVELIISYIR